MEIRKSRLISEGKTKQVFSVRGHPELAILASKNTITAHDDPLFTREFETKARCSTTVSTWSFELLREAGIPVAFREQLSETEMLVDRVEMLLLEVVGRRYPFGSFLKRHPEIEMDPDGYPVRWAVLKRELFLKTTRGKFRTRRGRMINLRLDPEKGQEDPFIEDPTAKEWQLRHSKVPAWQEDSRLGQIRRSAVVNDPDLIVQIDHLLRQVFYVLEAAWAMMGFILVDIKIEVGITRDGRLVVADVLDADSWRLVRLDWEDFSKQSFRDGEDLSKVERKYLHVVDLVSHFEVQNQALVLWRGSMSDPLPEVPQQFSGVEVVEVVLSAHRQTERVITRLNELHSQHRHGVIIVKVGKTNGLGPVLGAHTTWPVFSIPVDMDRDVASSLRVPRGVAHVVGGDHAVIGTAFNVLGARNPFVRASQQQALEDRISA